MERALKRLIWRYTGTSGGEGEQGREDVEK
jgi:hypothetical protein